MKNSIATLVAAAALALPGAAGAAYPLPSAHIEHVLLISVDGMHSLDLTRFVARHPKSTLAWLARHGVTYPDARTVAPADSFPGLLALVTGGTPAVTGVYYDDSYDRRLSPPGSDCTRTGTAVVYDEAVDGPGAKAGKPSIDPDKLPRDPAAHCTPVYPHDYLRVNTVFEVVRQAGGYTAWIDKHPSYEIVDGPSGKGVDDLYTPEIGADGEGVRKPGEDPITSSIARTEHFDAFKAEAVVHEVDGFRHDGRTPAPVPALFGFNVQAVNVAEKLSGYRDARGDPAPGLEAALEHTDRLIGRIVAEMRAKDVLDSTLVIVTAKHGNGPIDPRRVRHVDAHALFRAVEAAVPGALAHMTTDQVALIWLRKQGRTDAVARALEHARKRLGIRRVLYGAALARRFPPPRSDSRTPDLTVIPDEGVIYAGPGNRKKAEHGGFAADDVDVALLVANPHLARQGVVVRKTVSTTQVAPTILSALGLAPGRLKAVAEQHTPVLPGEDW